MLTAHVNDSSMVDDIDNTEFDQTIVDFVEEMDKWINFLKLTLANTNKYLYNILYFTFNKEYYLNTDQVNLIYIFVIIYLYMT